jgi:hypothetical protein
MDVIVYHGNGCLQSLPQGNGIPVPVGNLRPEILAMQPAQNWHGQRATDGLDSTWDWRVLVQR